MSAFACPFVAGVDEVGRGPLAGSVVAAAVILPNRGWPQGLADSKKLTTLQRESLNTRIRACALAFALGQACVAEIDRLNILQASLLAMRRAVMGLALKPTVAWVDGNRPPTLAVPVRTVVGGDGKVAAISAASIVAKVARDAQMAALDQRYPGYGFARHKGYGTAQHHRALQEFGVTPIHRRSFAPVARLVTSAQTDLDYTLR